MIHDREEISSPEPPKGASPAPVRKNPRKPARKAAPKATTQSPKGAKAPRKPAAKAAAVARAKPAPVRKRAPASKKKATANEPAAEVVAAAAEAASAAAAPAILPDPPTAATPPAPTDGPPVAESAAPVRTAGSLPDVPPPPEFSAPDALDFGEELPAPAPVAAPVAAPQPAVPPEKAPDPSARGEQRPPYPHHRHHQRFPRPHDRPYDQRPAQPAFGPQGMDDEEGELDEEARPGFRDRKRGKTRTLLGQPAPCDGILELSQKGFGFLRRKELNFRQTAKDVFVLPDTVRHFGLREGMHLEGEACNGPRGPQLTDLVKVNGRPPGSQKGLAFFEELTAINPNKRYVLETKPDRFTTRVIDMLTPVGRGQRGLIVSPPRSGKTTLLHHIAEAISENYEDVHLMMLLVDERPEEVTELTRALPKAEILASSNDNDVWSHIRIAEFGIQRAKRLVEEGRDVFILLDSITRLARAYNNSMRGKGRTMSGGVDARALEMPRRLFAAARNTREAGSLTIVGTALIETNSKADELIFQEFKGTGNMELVLDRKLSEQYVYPAVNLFKSGTRREELLLPPHQLKKIHLIRRGLAGHKPIEAMERLLHFLRMFPSNAQMLIEIKAQGY